jgi:hypothetical protein
VNVNKVGNYNKPAEQTGATLDKTPGRNRPEIAREQQVEQRIHHAGLAGKIMSAEQAATHIQPGMTVGMSGFTGSGYPKAVPLALAGRMEAAQGRGEKFALRVLTGASTAPELDGAWPRLAASIFACRISPTRSCAPVSTVAKSTIWMCIWARWRSTPGLAFWARSTWRWWKWPVFCRMVG